MKDYEFTLNFKLPNKDLDAIAIMEALGEAGCTDALVGLGVAGCVGLQFNRAAKNASTAFKSALNDVKKALPDAILAEAAPDIVGLSEVANIAKVTRQNLRKLMEKNSDSFPHPLHTGSTVLWHLADVTGWLAEEKQYNIEASVLEVAKLTKQVNLIKSSQEIEPELAKSFGAI